MLEIRPALPAEFPAVADVCEAAYDPYLRGDGHYRAVLRDVARRAADAEVLVAADGGAARVLGTVTFVPDGGPLGEIAGPAETEFRMLAVDPSAQGRGVGAALLARVARRQPRPRQDRDRLLEPSGDARRPPRLRARRVPPRAAARLVAHGGRAPARVRDDARRLRLSAGAGAVPPVCRAASLAAWRPSARATTKYAGRTRPVGPTAPSPTSRAAARRSIGRCRRGSRAG